MEIRTVTDDEFFEWRINVRMNLGDHVSEEDTRYMRAHRVELDRLLVCRDGDAFAGSGGADSFDMTLPGGATVPVAGVAYITTASTHRRRGVQRGIMRRIHDDARERGDLASILWASQSLLYGRYGYGNTMPVHNWRINLDHTAFAHAPEWSGHFVRPQRDEAIPMMAHAYDLARVNRPGMITRTSKRWQYEVHPRHRKDEFFLIYIEGDEPLAYARFEIRRSADEEFTGTLHVVEAVASTDASHAALWRHLFDQELVNELTAHARPVDDPIIWMLADPRRLGREFTDAIWLKLLDPAQMLTERTYPVEGSLTIETRDSETGITSRFALEGGSEGAQCAATNDRPDLVMQDGELAAAYMGAVSFSMLVELGLAEESPNSPGAAKRADAMFRTVPAGWNPYHF